MASVHFPERGGIERDAVPHHPIRGRHVAIHTDRQNRVIDVVLDGYNDHMYGHHLWLTDGIPEDEPMDGDLNAY